MSRYGARKENAFVFHMTEHYVRLIASVPAAKKVVIAVTVAVKATKTAVKRRRIQKCLSRKRNL